MTKPKVLYHGSYKKIKGNLVPKKATGLGSKKGKLIGVYATHKKEAAIIMAMISGNNDSSMKNETTKPRGIIYKGSLNKNIWLYILPVQGFKKLDSWQWINHEEVEPIEIKKIDTKKYARRVRMATDKEKRLWYKKFEKELKSAKKA